MTSIAPFLLVAGALAVHASVAALRARDGSARGALAAALATTALELFAASAISLRGAEPPLVWHAFRQVTFAAGAGTWLWFAATYARGDRLSGLQRRLPLWTGMALPLLCALAAPGPLLLAGEAGSPPVLGTAGFWLHGAGLVAAIVSLLQLERTFAASVGMIRWRLKFMVFGAGALIAERLFTGSQLLITRRLDPALDGLTAGSVLIGAFLILRALRRSRGAAPSVYPSQAVLRGSVTLLLAGIYLLLLGVAASSILRIAGPTAFAPVAFATLAGLLGLAVAAHSEQARWRLKRILSRHFRRPLHDARTLWLRLTAATSRCPDPASLGRAVATLVAGEFHALSVAVWLVDPRRETLEQAASTAGPVETGNGASSAGLPVEPIAAHFHAHPAAVELEKSEGRWAADLRAANPAVFDRMPHRAVVPLIDHGEFLGVLVVGDRVDGSPFMPGDLEMLECVASQVAANLQGLRLSQSLGEARQLEAFQGMAAFFIHDLKNASFLLSLMLQNLTEHFDKPAFRADALRSVSQACGHLNDLVRRLGGLREGLRIEPGETDLNEVVSAALREVPRPGTVALEAELVPLPTIRADRSQLRKVVTNLLLNATEAVAGEGRIRVATGSEDGWAVLTVRDTGCGMSERFVSDSLFRPFRTTKPSGLGIGMFQSRSIVEAHGGKITVNSRPGEGTVFRVFLRANLPASTS